MSDPIPIIETKRLAKSYKTGKVTTQALKRVDLSVKTSEFLSICGPSGCGKSTLLYTLGGLAKRTSGDVIVNRTSYSSLSDPELTKFRQENIGFVFQRFNLINSLNVIDNLKLVYKIEGKNPHDFTGKIRSLINLVGLSHREKSKPLELSQGEQQRVAIARALLKEPKVLLADEPTGNLDTENSEKIMTLFHEANRQLKQTILMITHNTKLAKNTHRLVEMKDGEIHSDGHTELGAAAAKSRDNGA